MRFILLGLLLLSTNAFSKSGEALFKFKNGLVVQQIITKGEEMESFLTLDGKRILDGTATEYATGVQEFQIIKVDEKLYYVNQDGKVAEFLMSENSKLAGLISDKSKMIYLEKSSKLVFPIISDVDVILVIVDKKGNVKSYSGFGKYIPGNSINLSYRVSKQNPNINVFSIGNYSILLRGNDFNYEKPANGMIYPESKYNLFGKSKQTPDYLSKMIKNNMVDINSKNASNEIEKLSLTNKEKAPIYDSEGKLIENPEEYIKKNFEIMTKNKSFTAQEIEALKNNPEIKELRIGLLSGSSVVLGESGSGKSHVAKEFLQAAMNGAFPEIDASQMKVVILDSSTLSQGTKYVGSFDSKINALIQYADNPNVFVFIDELHSLRGAGTSSNNSNDVFEKLKKPISEGKLKVIATDTTAEFFNAFGGDQAIIRRFAMVTKNPPQGEELITVIESWLAKNNYPKMARNVIERAIQHSEDYSTTASQPSRTIAPLQRMINERIIEGVSKKEITISDLDESFRKYYKLDKSFTDVELRAIKLSTFLEKMDSELIGMNVYKTKTEDLLFQAESGIHDPNRPLLRGFLAGPRGSGKTYSTIILAKQLGRKWKRIEMNQYSSPYADATDLLREVARALKESSQTVIVFDEFEKANQKVQNAVLALLDSGKFTTEETLGSSSNAPKHTVSWDARNAMFFATSNAGDDVIKELFAAIYSEVDKLKLPEEEAAAKVHELFAKALSEEDFVKILVDKGISEPVLDRFHYVLPVLPATKAEFRKVLKIEINTAIREFELRKKFKIKIENVDEFIEKIMTTFYEPNVSNRFAIKVIQSELRTQIAKHLIANRTASDFSIKLDLSRIKKSKLCQEALAEEAPAPRRRIGYKPDMSTEKAEPKPLGYKPGSNNHDVPPPQQ